MKRFLLVLPLICLTALSAPADEAAVKSALEKAILAPRTALLELQDHTEALLPKMPRFTTAGQWNTYAQKLRQDILDKVVLRGEGGKWRAAKLAVEYRETIAGGAGYKIRKLRYEAIPALWIPALLYVPDKLAGKVPVMLAVNGHDSAGKSARYKQVRCINLAKRGMLVLNLEWFGMGQLRSPGNQHGCLNQIDLCGTSGLAPFYLALTRGIDVLLAQENADPKRVAVSGLSGGGWQTILVGALDPRVTLANPVAGYTSFASRLRDHARELGDSEQTPADLATLADYTHLTALRAPRPTLLTWNAKDDCCFRPDYALPPLLAAGRPVFKLFDKESALRSHINHDPGTHNFEKDNRQALYRMIGDFFYPGDKKFSPVEIPCDKEIKPADDLAVELPKGNSTLNGVARALARKLPLDGELPRDGESARAWQTAKRKQLRSVLRPAPLSVNAAEVGRVEKNGTLAIFWKLKLSAKWTVPVVELVRGKPAKTAILLNDSGRKADPSSAERLLRAGCRVLAVDLFYFGEARLLEHGWMFALVLNAVGDRPLGLQAAQLLAVAAWSSKQHTGSVALIAVGPRTSLIALAAAALVDKSIDEMELDGCRASLKEVIDENRTVDQMPEVFCFGLLQVADVKQLAALAAARNVVFRNPPKGFALAIKELKSWRETLAKGR
jgi:dienelactone hydrolase